MEEYLKPNHIVPCRKLEASCSLGCDIKIKSIQEGIYHILKPFFSWKVQRLRLKYLNKMQGSHDCISDLKEKVQIIEEKE